MSSLSIVVQAEPETTEFAMRRVLAALGLLRPCAVLESACADREAKGGFTLGSPYFVCTGEKMEGPFWPAVLGPTPEGYLPEPSDSGLTFGDDASELLLACFGLSKNAQNR